MLLRILLLYPVEESSCPIAADEAPDSEDANNSYVGADREPVAEQWIDDHP